MPTHYSRTMTTCWMIVLQKGVDKSKIMDIIPLKCASSNVCVITCIGRRPMQSSAKTCSCCTCRESNVEVKVVRGGLSL